MSKILKRIDFDPEFQPVFLSPVIGREVFDALDQAKGIIAKARLESARLRKEASTLREQAVVEKADEKKRGYEQGHQEGLAKLTQKIIEVQKAKEKFLKEAEPEIIRMVMDIAEKIIGRELEKGAIVDVVRQALDRAMGKKVTVRVHPSDLQTLKEKEPEMQTFLDPSQSVSFKEDESISAGGCIIESELGTVDSRLEMQLGAIRKALGLPEK